MIAESAARTAHRVLVVAPTGRDAALVQAILEKAGIDASVCADMPSASGAAAEGVGALVVAQEALGPAALQLLAQLVQRQPAWSELPLIILTHTQASGADAAASAALGNVILLERPLRVQTLLSTVRVALRARTRQYELRDRFEARELLAAIVASSDDAIVSKSLDGVILSWNHGAERMFGYSEAEAIGRPITLIIPPDRLDEERGIIERLVRGESIDHFETVRITKDGRAIDVSLTISPIRDSDGRILGASKVARDITAQKLADQALRDADRRKDEFLATLAHELRNPLAPIRNSINVLRLSRTADPSVERVHEMMERQVNHMVRLVDDLLEVSRITRGQIELRREPVELAGVIRSAVEASQPLIDAGGHRLALAIPPEPLTLDADPTRLAQVFANLLNNAARYTEEPGEIVLTARREGSSLAVSVRDTGVGIPADMLPRVFDLFMQGDRSRRASQGGLGIGLTLVKSLVEMHGGSVTVASAGIGKGSEFVVRLPLASGAPAESAEPRTEPPALAPVRVLVVDDNRDSADSLGILLKSLGAQVRVVHDGPAALQAMDAFRPALALLDIGMPRMDGHEVARRIRARPAHEGVTLVALTGWCQEEDRQRSFEAGFDEHFVKPLDIAKLQALIARVAKRGEPSSSELAT